MCWGFVFGDRFLVWLTLFSIHLAACNLLVLYVLLCSALTEKRECLFKEKMESTNKTMDIWILWDKRVGIYGGQTRQGDREIDWRQGGVVMKWWRVWGGGLVCQGWRKWIEIADALWGLQKINSSQEGKPLPPPDSLFLPVQPPLTALSGSM